MRAEDILVIYLLHTIISDFPEVKVTEILRRPDPSLLVSPDLVSASEQIPLHGNWAHHPCTIAKAAFGTQTLFFMYLPPNEGLGPTGCPPRYLHTLSKTDPVKLLMVTSTSSTGKKNEVQMEEAPVSNVHS